MTEQQAHARARKASIRGERFVIRDVGDDEGAGPYFVASAFDLETFWQGIGDENVLACYIGGERA